MHMEIEGGVISRASESAINAHKLHQRSLHCFHWGHCCKIQCQQAWRVVTVTSDIWQPCANTTGVEDGHAGRDA